MNRETRLMRIAQEVSSQKIAREAMQALRNEFDKTYGWCEDCDGLVVKEKDCCENRMDEIKNAPNLEPF